MDQVTGETSSADPQALSAYTEAGLRIDTELETTAIPPGGGPG